MLFLAQISYTKTRYMHHDSEEKNELRLVEADDEKQAYQKVEAYFEEKTEEYAVYYSINSITILETIS